MHLGTESRIAGSLCSPTYTDSHRTGTMRKMRLIGFQTFANFSVVLLISLLCCGCSRENPQDLKEKTAHATAELKRDAKAVAGGIREGWGRYKTVDVNSATKDQLMTLPGLTAKEADSIIAGRPYSRTNDLVTRHILSEKEYTKISDLLNIGKR